MSFSTTPPREDYVGTGSLAAYDYHFKILAATDLRVTTRTTVGVEIALVYITDYTVSGVGNANGGTVTLTAGNLTSGVRLTIRLDRTPQQTTDLRNQGAFNASTHEAKFDEIVRYIQAQRDVLSRTLHLPETEVGSDALTQLPTYEQRLNKYLYVDSTGQVTAVSVITAGSMSVSSFIQTVLDDSTAAAARATLDIVGPGTVLMIRTGNGTWAVYAPDGTTVSIAGSTTDGLQEAINYCSTNGHNLYVSGGSCTSGGVNVATISCTTGIVWPPMQGKTIRFDWCTVNFSSAVTGTGMFFDSCMMVSFWFSGQIVYVGNGNAITFTPTNNVPLDAVKGVLDSRFYLNTLAVIGGTNPAGINFDSSLGPITGNRFEFIEINGANGATVYGRHGIVIGSSVSADGIISNHFSCRHLHKWSGSSIQIGDSTAAATSVHSNTFDLGIFPDGAASVAVQVYAVENYIRCAILNNEGTVNTGVKLESSADKNVFDVVRNNAATLTLNDVSTTKSNMGMGGSYAVRASVHRNGVNQTGIVTATFTKVQFAIEAFDYGLAYDPATNHRWTPGRLGVGRVNARVGWVTAVDQTDLLIAVYKNGTIYKHVSAAASGANADQGLAISVLVDVGAIADYFEVFVKQTSGSNKDINGATDTSWVMYEMLG